MFHAVEYPRNHALSCDDQCLGFKSQHICAHTIAAACFNGCQESYLCLYTPRLSTLVNSSIPIHTGRKDNEKRQRKRTSNGLRDVSGDSAQHIPEDIGTEQKTDDLEVVFISDTAACKCYGCNGAVRAKPSEDPPAAPYEYRERKDQQRCA